MTEQRDLPHGSEKPAESDDPMTLVGVGLPGDPDRMVTCFIEEYAALGWAFDQILELFRRPEYRTHRFYRQHGEEWVRERIRRTLRKAPTIRTEIQRPGD